ncbi:TlpA disulfide reductase family protein [Mucilaginibacter jinjuensis]|uniref:TlpA disulfide reductase family protein n=1 Tax=Mucilaginibacter jinjuensis TaxID=1176721 RepID=A0ABY7T6R2_9SPHI|nr:TlpA disulfide reductase family protein [Mucilaginibacter jinjuensis]WCT11958.1 TlpA disulfide reductase family protein [Mucilaginibacter jinjuensis]
MKNLFLSFLFAMFISNSYAQQVNISGKADFLKNGDTIKLTQQHLSRMPAGVALSTAVKNGRFSFSFNQPAAELYALSYHHNSKNVFLDAGNLEIDLVDSSLQKATLKGNTVTNDEYEAFSEIINEDEAGAKFYATRKKFFLATGGHMDTALYAKIKPQMDSLLAIAKQDKVNNTLAWIKAHSTSQINSYILIQNTMGRVHIDGVLPGDQLRTIFNALPDTVKKNSWGKELQEELNGLVVGGTAPDFAEVNPNGKLIKLSDFKGKYVLLDFWASWCVPCRAENPNVVAAYQKYKAKNFDILSVSLDVNKADWIKAIKHDGMPWNHVCDPHHSNHWDSRVAKLYNVGLVPSNFLIDPNGVIIAKNLQGEELQQTLKKLFE